MSSHSLQNEGYYAFKRTAIDVVKRRLLVTQSTEMTQADWVTHSAQLHEVCQGQKETEHLSIHL